MTLNSKYFFEIYSEFDDNVFYFEPFKYIYDVEFNKMTNHILYKKEGQLFRGYLNSVSFELQVNEYKTWLHKLLSADIDVKINHTSELEL